MKKLAAIGFGCALLFSGPAFGFGADGHEAICEIAYRDLTDTARARVDALIGEETNTNIETFRDSCIAP